MLKKGRWVLWLCLWLVACRGGEAVVPTVIVEETAVPTSIPTPATAVPGTLLVDPAIHAGKVSPYLFGSNYGPWTAVPADMLSAAYDSGVQALRFPGGEWGDRNDLKSYHIDPFMDFVKQVGAIPTISVRLLEGTPEQASELVRYVNVEKEYGVQFWSIGNEPTLYAGHFQAEAKADDYETEQFNREWREFALAMKAVDPTIKLIGPEVGQFNDDVNYNPKDSSGRDWMIEFLKANGDLVDVVSFHRYPFPKNSQENATIDDLRQHMPEWDRTIPYLRSLMQEYAGRDIPIAITEVNTHYNKAVGTEATPDSHFNAIWVADMFGRLMYQDVFMVNHWLLTSSGGGGGWGLIGRGELRHSYWVYQLYQQFGTELVYTDSGVEDVTVYAARRDDGALTIMVVNTADTEKQVKLEMVGETAVVPYQLWRLDQEHIPETAVTLEMTLGEALSLPSQSLSLLIINS
jgi:hypothetical protein